MHERAQSRRVGGTRLGAVAFAAACLVAVFAVSVPAQATSPAQDQYAPPPVHPGESGSAGEAKQGGAPSRSSEARGSPVAAREEADGSGGTAVTILLVGLVAVAAAALIAHRRRPPQPPC